MKEQGTSVAVVTLVAVAVSFTACNRVLGMKSAQAVTGVANAACAAEGANICGRPNGTGDTKLSPGIICFSFPASCRAEVRRASSEAGGFRPQPESYSRAANVPLADSRAKH